MDEDIVFYCITIFVLLLISAFFAAAETALTAVSRARIYQLVMDGNKLARKVSALRKEKEAMIGTVLLGYNAVNIAASVLATSLSIKVFGDEESQGLIFTTVIMTVLVVVFTEVLPKTYAIHNSERASLLLATPLGWAVKIFRPITASIQVFIRVLLKCIGVDISKSSNSLVSASDVIRGTIELHHREGKMIKQDRDMLGSILDLNDIEVQDIMGHRMEVETLDADIPAHELAQKAVSTMHSRIPLWRGEPDNIIGLLHVKDLIKLMGEKKENISNDDIVGICKKPWFIPETTSLHDQLLAFRSQRQHFAFVVDEYGGWQGIVTLEDIIEEIVGEIEDEHDEEENEIQKIDGDIFIVNGGVTIRDLNRQLGWNLPDDDASTIAGLLIHEAENIPEIGETIDMYGFSCTVLQKSAMQVTKIKMRKLPEAKVQEEVEL